MSFANVTAADTRFTWLRENDYYDFVVAITVRGKSSGAGILFDRDLVLTTATVGEMYLKTNLYQVMAYGAYGYWYLGKSYYCTCGITPYRIERKEFWMSIGLDGHHCPVHDLFVLYCPATYGSFGPESSNATYRTAFSTYLARPHHGLLKSYFTVAAFGFVDQDHVEKMNQLEVDWYGYGTRVDCDFYIPREWGRFICIKNDFNIVGVQSGAPLMHRGLIYGIGSFALQKGNENILVFTDVRGYSEHLHICKRIRGQVKNFYWWSRYWG